MVTLATFNVKDLFDAAFIAKIEEIAAQLARADADVIGFQEIGNEDALHAVFERVPGGSAYRTRIFGPPDHRGIRNAIVTRLQVVHQCVHLKADIELPTFHEGDPQPFLGRIPLRRGIPHARVDAPGLGQIDVLVAHFKSKRSTPFHLKDGSEAMPATQRERAEGDVRSLISRCGEALFMRGLVDAAELESPLVAVMGDLNDTVESVPVRIVKGRGDGRLHSCASQIPREHRFSVLHGTWRDQIDHILVSSALRSELESAAFFNEALKDQGPFLEHAPPTVESDHALFVARFRSRPSLVPSEVVVTQRSG